MMDHDVKANKVTLLVDALGDALRARRWTLSTAESCTGGLIGHLLTGVSGSSDWYVGGLVAYANRIKTDLLGVDPKVIEACGAVSSETVKAMVRGACSVFTSQVAVAVSGIAGPTGGTPDKPVGTVWVAWALPEGEWVRRHHFEGDRAQIKGQAADAAIKGLAAILDGDQSQIAR